MQNPLRTIGGRVLVGVAAVALVASGITTGAIVAEGASDTASAVSTAGFDPGNIISDGNFYNGNALDANGVQGFLNSIAPNCRQQAGGPPCLKNFSQSTPTIPAAAGRCSAIGGGVKSAATIIAQVGQACGISQKALLVLLQKEQSIVATNAPTNYMYQHATGFACPDTAPCDPAYRGFLQQVYAAGLQFKRYQDSPSYFSYRAGRTNNILYNPNGACGTKAVYIQNSATAGLYNYTPYTPNQAALNAGWGTGDGCSAYGNRNFWLYYSSWFGSPTGGANPIGSVDAVVGGAGTIAVSGWAADPDTTNPLRVAFYVDGVGQVTITGDAQRPDLAGLLGSGNTAHGYSTTLAGISAGNHSVCVYAINQGPGSNTLLACRNVSVQAATAGPPKGSLDQAKGGAGVIDISGWALDQDGTAPFDYKVQVDGVGLLAARTDTTRTDVAAAYPGVGSQVGFAKRLTGIAAGTRRVTLWTPDLPGGSWVKVATASATVTAPTSAAPSTGSTGKSGPVTGAFETATGGQGTIGVTGWAIDPDVYDPVKYKVQVDGVGAAAGSANASRPDIAAKQPGWGSDVGIALTLQDVAPGSHSVTVWLQDLPSGAYTKIGAKTVTVTAKGTGASGPVTGSFDSATGGQGSISVAGWARDPDTFAPVGYKVQVDGVGAAQGSANGARPDLAGRWSGWGSNLGLARTISGLSAGQHSVTVWYQDMPSGAYTKFGAKTVTVAAKPTGRSGPVNGSFDVATGGTGTVAVSGWAIDPDTYDPVLYKVQVDGVGVAAGASNAVRTDVERAFPGWGSRVGTSATISGVKPGTHTVTLWFRDLPSGAYTKFGAKTVTVR